MCFPKGPLCIALVLEKEKCENSETRDGKFDGGKGETYNYRTIG